MGIRRCLCRASGTAVGTIPIGELQLGVSITADICPNCTLGGSDLDVQITSPVPIGDLFSSVSFVGLPVCENGVLIVDAIGNLNPTFRTALVNLQIDVPPDPLAFELTLNAAGQICLTFPNFGLLDVCADGSVTVSDCLQA